MIFCEELISKFNFLRCQIDHSFKANTRYHPITMCVNGAQDKVSQSMAQIELTTAHLLPLASADALCTSFQLDRTVLQRE